jgi:lipoate-protein ligase B
MDMLRLIDLGTIPYIEGIKRQSETVREVADGMPDALILCEHPKTLTLGRRWQEDNLFQSRERFAADGFTVAEVDRGGDVTLHAPGQLILYPIIRLRPADMGLRKYLQKLEQVAVDLLGDFDIVAKGDDGNRGVWVGARKIASIGVGVRHWVTYHGMGLNINTDLSLFRAIRPCGLNVGMTSLASETGRSYGMDQIKLQAADHFRKVFGYP